MLRRDGYQISHCMVRVLIMADPLEVHLGRILSMNLCRTLTQGRREIGRSSGLVMNIFGTDWQSEKKKRYWPMGSFIGLSSPSRRCFNTWTRRTRKWMCGSCCCRCCTYILDDGLIVLNIIVAMPRMRQTWSAPNPLSQEMSRS